MFSILKIFQVIKIRTTLTVVLIIAGIYYLYVNISQLQQLGQQLNFVSLGAAFFFAILAIVISAYKLKLTIDLSLKKNILFNGWVEVFVKSFLLNNFFPYAGIAYRGIHLKKYYGVSYTEYVASSYLYGVVGLTILLGSAALFLSFHYHSAIFLSFIIGLLTLFRFKFYFFKKFSRLNFKNQKINFYLEKLGAIDSQFKVILSSDKRALFFLFFFISVLVDFFSYSLVFTSIHADAPWHLMIFVYLPYSLAWLIKLTPGNVGVQEFLMGGMSAAVGLGSVSGVVLSILLRLTNLLGAFIIWFLSAVTHK